MMYVLLQGDLFGNSGKDNTQGMLYLSRMDPSRDPKKTRLDTAEEQKRRSLAQLGVKEGEDSVAEHEVGPVEVEGYTICCVQL